MKSIPKLIKRFIGIFLLSSVLILAINIIAFAVLMANQIPHKETSPYNIAKEAGKALHVSANGDFTLPEHMSTKLKDAHAWAILIDNDTSRVVWKTKNVPSTIPASYTLSDIAQLSVGYLKGYPTYTGENERGVVVVGFPHNSFWKHTTPSWNYSLISNSPQIVLGVLCINICLVLGIYVIANMKLLKSVNPIIKGIQRLSTAERVHIPETGALSEISAHINSTSDVLQQQKEQLRKKEMARANWIAGVSHDIRTPLSMVMGYAGQLASSSCLETEDRKKANMIMKQSERMKNLINDLNLASKLEYNMQPIKKKEENAVSVVRQVVVDFINMDMQGEFEIVWETDESLTTCNIFADKDLLKRAISNLMWNSITHNESGCTIYVSVSANRNNCMICVEDNGIGVSDEKLKQLNHTPHYMICDTSTTEQRHGLGLLIVEQIVDAHNGRMSISKSKHGGFMTTLTLPQIEVKSSYSGFARS